MGFTDDGIPLLAEETARRAMEQAAALGVPISFHEENPAFIENNGINRGKASAFYGIGGSDRQAEIDLVARDVRLAEETGACVVIQHISTKEAVQLVREAKKRGADVHAEATPHHFTLTEEAAIKYGTMAKMNPPLREEADRLAIIEGLKDNTIDMIATDHAPHSAEEKARELTAAPSGIIGLETSHFPGLEQLVDKGELTLSELIERMSLAPARLYHLDAGRLTEGGPAGSDSFSPGGNLESGAFSFQIRKYSLPGPRDERKNPLYHSKRKNCLPFLTDTEERKKNGTEEKRTSHSIVQQEIAPGFMTAG